MSSEFLALLPVSALLAGMLLELALARALSPRGKGWLAFASGVVALGGVVARWPTILSDQTIEFHLLAWDGPAALAYHVDGLSLLFALMAAGIGSAVLLYSVNYMADGPSAGSGRSPSAGSGRSPSASSGRSPSAGLGQGPSASSGRSPSVDSGRGPSAGFAQHPERSEWTGQGPSVTRFYALMLVFVAGLIHLVYSADLLLMYLSWEVIGLCSFFLVGFWYRQKEAASGARKVLVMTHIAGYGLLAAVLLLYSRTGSTLWTDPQIATAFSSGIFVLTLLAAVAKSVQFPLHTWIPDAMAAPTPVSALLHAACYVKAGVYLIARLHSLEPWPVAWQTTVIWIGTLTLLVGGLYAMVQSDLKRLLAFSTVSQIGYIVLGLGLSTPLGIAAGLLHCFNHGLFKSGLFLCAGAVQRATGTRDMDRLGGLARRMPTTTALWLIMAGSVAGVPLLSGFVSKWLLFNAALEAGQIVPALISWVVSVITVFYFLKATAGVFLGDESPEAGRAHEAPRTMLAGTIVLAALCLLLGVAPQLAVRYVINPLLPALGVSSPIQISWLGLTAGSGSFFATGGLILAMVAVGSGALVYWLARSGPRMATAGATPGTGGVFTGGEPLIGPSRLPASDFSLIVRQGLEPFYRWVDADRYYLVLWRALLRLSDELGKISAWLERNAIPATLVLTLLLALVAAVGIPVSGGPVIDDTQALDETLLAGVGVALLGLLVAASLQKRLDWLLMGGAGLLAVVGLGMSQPTLRLVLLEAAALVALGLVWRTTRSRHASRVYLLAVLLSTATTVGGVLTLDSGSPGLSLALLLAGLTLKLALVPLYLWLPLVAEATPALVVGLIAAVVDVAAFGQLLALRSAAPWLFDPQAPWLALALLSSLGGAVLMLTQRDLKRLLAFSTIEDTGYLLLGLTLGGELGSTGAIIGATVHALAKALLFASLSAPEAEGPLTLETRGLASRFPLSGAGFLLGVLATLGIPPTAGYAARWRLYGAAAQTNPWLLAALLLGTSLAVLAYARVVATCWWGPSAEARRREPVTLIVALVGLSLALLLTGLWPSLLSG